MSILKQPVQAQSLLFEISKSVTSNKQPSNILEFLIIFIHGYVILKLYILGSHDIYIYIYIKRNLQKIEPDKLLEPLTMSV